MNSTVAQSRAEQIFEALRALRVTWFAPILAFVALVIPPQVADLYRAMAQTRNLPQIGITLLLLLLAGYLTYRVGRHRALVAAPSADRRLLSLLLRWGPAVCAALVVGAGALGIYLSAVGLPEVARGIDEEIDKTVFEMTNAARILTLAAAGLGIAALLFLLLPLFDRRVRDPEDTPRFALGTLALVVAYAVVAFMIGMAFFPALAISVSNWLGSVAIYLLFLCTLIISLSVLQSASDRTGIPWILLLAIWAVALAVVDKGDSHRANMVPSPVKGQDVVQLQYAFQEWYNSRADREAYKTEPYPVFLIAAESGGLYAAEFAARVLARLQDRCPNFAQHVFAISGVSGGSLGASVFANLATKYAKNGPWEPCKLGPDTFEKKVDAILKQDFLAPIVSRAFFADFLQRFLPSPLIVKPFSRGRAFEESVEQAWAQVEGSANNPYAGPFLSHWTPTGVTPALMLNTTSVNDGRQVIIAPFASDTDDSLYSFGYLHQKKEFPAGWDLTLGSAVGLSGRFPWILPVATVGDSRIALVDGAYFEGSGIESLITIRNALRTFEVPPDGQPLMFPYIAVHVLAIGSAQPPAQQIRAQTLDEATPPLRTMLHARERRGYLANDTLREWSRMLDCKPMRPEAMLASSAAGGSDIKCAARPPQVARLNYDYFNLPLGWQLSDGMRRIIRRHSHGRCEEQQPKVAASLEQREQDIDEDANRARSILRQNSLLTAEVADLLYAGPREGQDMMIKVVCD